SPMTEPATSSPAIPFAVQVMGATMTEGSDSPTPNAAPSVPVALTWEGARPFTLNWERTKDPRTVAKIKKIWRERFWSVATQKKAPRMEAAIIVAQVHLKNHYHQDVGSAYPTVKAAIDGLVDAKVLPDDDPRYVRGLIFLAPECGSWD